MKRIQALALAAIISLVSPLSSALAEDYFYWPEFGTFVEHNNWATKSVKAPEANKLGATGKGIKIAILDDGLAAYDHGLAAKVVAFKDFVPGQYLRGEHGTMVASTIASDFNPAFGFGGIAPDVSLMVGRVCHRNGCEWEAIGDAISWATENGADVISMSFTGSMDPKIHAKLRIAIDSGVVVVGAMGNSGCGPYGYWGLNRACLQGVIRESTQALYPMAGLIAVGASDQRGARVATLGWSSSFGPNMDIIAPGVDTSAFDSVGASNGFGGTSSATPIVAGVAALILSIKPDLTPSQVQAILQASAQPALIEKAKVWDSCSQDSVTLVWSCNNIVDSLFPQQYYTGAGLIDAEAAVKLTKKLASNQLLAKPTITQSDLKLNISWDGGPADLYLNSERVARNIDSGYEYQGYQNQSVAAQIVRNGQPSEPAMVIVANSYIPDAPELQNIFLGDNILRFDAGDLELKADKVWRKYWPWDPTNLVEYSGVFESDTGLKVACAGSKNSYNNQARFTCRMPEGLAAISGTFRIVGKSSELGEPSASFTAIGYRSTTSIPVTVSYGDDGMPTFTWAAVAGAQSYYYRYEREANFHCTQNTTLATANLEIVPAGFTVSAFSEPDCSGTLLAATESITYIPLPPKPAKPTGISVLFQSFQHVEFQMANRDPQSQYRIYRSDGLMVRIQPGQQLNVPAQANEDINGRTFSYRFVQIKSSTWSDSWSEPSDPIFVTPLTVAEPNARCHFKTDVNSIACEVDAVSGAQRTRIEYLDSDYQVLQAGEYEYSQLNQFYPTGTRVPHGAVYVRTSATWGDANSKYSWYRRGPGKTILVGQQKTQQLISQVR